jgi:hypothetical protein
MAGKKGAFAAHLAVVLLERGAGYGAFVLPDSEKT